MGRVPAPECCRRSCRRRTRGGEAATAGRFWVSASYSCPLWLGVIGAPGQDTPDGGMLIALCFIAYFEPADRLQFRDSNCGVQIRFRHAIQSDGRGKLSNRAPGRRQHRCRGCQAGCASPNGRRLRDRGGGTRLDRTGQATMACRRPVPGALQPEVARILTGHPRLRACGAFPYPAEGARAASISRMCTSSSSRRRAETAISSSDGVWARRARA
jgi:hypothetical protein